MADDGQGVVALERAGDVALVLVDHPPVNAISHAVRAGLVATISAAIADRSVRVMVLACRGASFFAGADITEFHGEERAPTADQLIELIEASPKPIVAAMHTRALGGGLELALACHYRIAAPGTVFGFPEVKLGLIPGLGGTQRFPRLVGLDHALDVIPDGIQIDAARALAIGLVDQVIAGSDLLAGARIFAKGLSGATVTRLVRNCAIALDGDPAPLLAKARARIERRYRDLSAPLRCVDAIEFGLTENFDAALLRERAIFEECLRSQESRSLMYLFFAEREARKLPELRTATPARPIAKVGIVGGGTMGRGIGIAVLEAGFQLVLVERDEEGARRCADAIGTHLDGREKAGKLRGTVAEAMQRAQFSTEWERLAACDMVIEAVFESLDLKRTVFARLDTIADPQAILATNTSGIDVNRIAAATKRPQAVLGLHFFSPANVMRLLEVVQGAATSPETLVAALGFAKKLDKVAVVARVCDGFIANRMFDEYWREAEFLVEEGVSPYDVDRALESFGMAMGPFAVSDLTGLDIGHAVRTRQREALLSSRIPGAEECLFQAGRLGRKSGAGWYGYADGRRAPDPEALRLLGAHRESIGRRGAVTVDDTTIVRRCFCALVNEACRLLEEGIARRASDIDLAAVHGYGFPSWRGGPMRWADDSGLRTILADIVANSRLTPSGHLRRCAESGATLT
jgi:3-hydroxyacyl-CoA dehydrogenase